MKKAARLLDIESEDLQRIFSDYREMSTSPSLFLALREALFYEVGSGISPPTLWVHNSFGPNGILTIGNSERPTRVNFDECRRRGIPVYVRTSGGWHIYNDNNFLFINVFIPAIDAEVLGMKLTKDNVRDQTQAFRVNSELTIQALSNIGVYARPIENDPSTIVVNGNLIAMNSARIAHGCIYMEGGIRYSDGDLPVSAAVLTVTEDEKSDMLQRNTAIIRHNGKISIDSIKSHLIETYKTHGGFQKYQWVARGLSAGEVQQAAGLAANYKSLTEMQQSNIEKVGLHDGKICILHWIPKYGSYTPGSY